jgi:hypothetical protein
MKRSPGMIRLEEVLRSSKIAAGGFLGSDPRPLEEILEADAAELARIGTTAAEIAERMQALTDAAKRGLGTEVRIGDSIEVSASDTRGVMVCPWPHAAGRTKTVTRLRRLDTGRTLVWSDLCIHLIGAHGFFQGRGSPFRLEPAGLAEAIFESAPGAPA